MAVARQKEDPGSKTRTIVSSCTSGVRCNISAPGGHVIVTDEPTERGGGDTAAPPLMNFTASLAACQTVQIVKVTEAMRFKHFAINITASTTTDLVEGVEGNKPVMRFVAAEMIIDIETDEPPARLERLRNLSEDRCPVGNLFSDAGYEPTSTWNALPLE